MPRTPGILAALETVVDDARQGIHVALPGRVESYDPAKQEAHIKPMVQVTSLDQDDARVVEPLPVIPDVPVAFPRGGGYFVTFPLNPGDTGLLVFCERDPGPWRSTSQDSDPLDDRLHGLTGAVFYPGLHAEAGALPSRPDHLVLGKEGGGPEVHLDGSTVQLGASGGDPVVKANASFISWVAAVSGATGAPAPTGYQATKAKAS